MAAVRGASPLLCFEKDVRIALTAPTVGRATRPPKDYHVAAPGWVHLVNPTAPVGKRRSPLRPSRSRFAGGTAAMMFVFRFA